jgi:hypothetical protein
MKLWITDTARGVSKWNPALPWGVQGKSNNKKYPKEKEQLASLLNMKKIKNKCRFPWLFR